MKKRALIMIGIILYSIILIVFSFSLGKTRKEGELSEAYEMGYAEAKFEIDGESEKAVTPELTPSPSPEVVPEISPEVTPEPSPESIPEDLSVMAITANRQKELTVYLINSESALRQQLLSVSEQSGNIVNLYLPDLSNFTGCEVVRADGKNKDSESVAFMDSRNQESTALVAGGSIQLRGMQKNAYYRILLHSKSGETYSMVLKLV